MAKPGCVHISTTFITGSPSQLYPLPMLNCREAPATRSLWSSLRDTDGAGPHWHWRAVTQPPFDWLS